MPVLLRLFALIALGCAIAPPVSLSMPPPLKVIVEPKGSITAGPLSHPAISFTESKAADTPTVGSGVPEASSSVLHQVEEMIPKMTTKSGELKEELGDLSTNEKVLSLMIEKVGENTRKSRDLVNTLQSVFVGLGTMGETLGRAQSATGAIIQTADKEAEALTTSSQEETRELQATDDSRSLLSVELDSLTGAISRKVNVAEVHESTLVTWASQLRDSTNVATKQMSALQAELLLVDDQMGALAQQLITLYSDVIKSEYPPGSAQPTNPLDGPSNY